MAAVVLPAKTKHTGTVIFLHGLGDSGHGWKPAAQEMQLACPHLKFVLPHAPEQPVTLNYGMKMPSWHDIKSLDKIDTEDFVGLDESKRIVESFIQSEVDAGVPSDRILVGGFSQGAALSLFTGYQSTHKLAGVVALSGYLPYTGDFGEAIAKGANGGTPALLCHGDSDNVVNPLAGKRAHEALVDAKVDAELKMYRNMAHSSCAAEIQQVVSFIKTRLPALD